MRSVPVRDESKNRLAMSASKDDGIPLLVGSLGGLIKIEGVE